MANKTEKQKAKLQARIEQLEADLRLTLQKKSHGAADSMAQRTREIAELKKVLALLG